MRGHPAHQPVLAAVRGLDVVLTAHSMAETYAVLTRLPGDARVSASDAARLVTEGFGEVLLPHRSSLLGLADLLAGTGATGGATYDALVAVAARDHAVPLASRDARAVGTYTAFGVSVRALPS